LELISGLTMDRSGNIYLIGQTESPEFPRTCTPVPNTPTGTFLTKVNPTGTAILFSSVNNRGVYTSVAVDEADNVHVGGYTLTGGFPLVKPLQATFNGGPLCFFRTSGPCADAFLMKLSGDGSRLLFSTYLGGTGDDRVTAITAQRGNITIAGRADFVGSRTDFPLTEPAWNPNGSMLVAVISEAADAPVFAAASVGNAASYEPGLTPGGIAALFGTGLTEREGVVAAAGFPLPAALSGVEVQVNGVEGPLLAVAKTASNEQINFQVPYSIAGESEVTVVVIRNGVRSLAVRVPLRAAQPGVFTSDGVRAVAQHPDYGLVTALLPAISGEVITVYMTGLGAVAPAVMAGSAAPANPLSRTVETPEITVGGKTAEVLFSGLTPGFAGLYQVNFRVPEEAGSGDVDLEVRIGGIAGNRTKLLVR